MNAYWYKLIAACLASICCATGLLATPVPARAASEAEVKALSLYADYRFGPKDQVLDVGIQPLWVPTSAITEAMKRDGVLRREMAKLGLKLRFHPFRLGPEGNAFLGPDRLDCMLAGDMPALTAAATKDVVIVTLVHQGFGAIVAKGVGSMAELRGKKVAYAPGSSTHFTLLRALKANGIGVNEVNLTPVVDLLNEAEKLNDGEWAAISTWDPLTSVVSRVAPGSVVLHRSLFEGYMYFTRKAVERNPRAVKLVIAAQIRAMGWMRQSSANLRRACGWALDEHRRFSGKPAPLTVDEYAAQVRSTLLDVAPNPEVDDEKLQPGGIIQGMQEFLVSQGAIPADTSFAKIKNSFNRRMVEEVLLARKDYLLADYDYEDEGAGR